MEKGLCRPAESLEKDKGDVMKAETREEIFIESVMTGDLPLNPETREEMYLAKAGGAEISIPAPITRKDNFLNELAYHAQDGAFEEALEALYGSGA